MTIFDMARAISDEGKAYVSEEGRVRVTRNNGFFHALVTILR
jgi:hypothetical protein